MFLKIVPLKELPLKLARSTIAFEKSASLKLESIYEIDALKEGAQDVSKFPFLVIDCVRIIVNHRSSFTPYHVDNLC